MKTTLATLTLLLFAGTASADTVWNYTGTSTSDPAVGVLDFQQQKFIPTPNPCGCAIEGSLTLSDGGIPVLWSFSAGAVTLTNLNSVFTHFSDTALLGNNALFSGWWLTLSGQGIVMETIFTGSNFEAQDGVSVAGTTYQYVQGNHGSFVDPLVSTPEPSSLALLGIGLVGLLARKRFQARRNQIPAETL